MATLNLIQLNSILAYVYLSYPCIHIIYMYNAPRVCRSVIDRVLEESGIQIVSSLQTEDIHSYVLRSARILPFASFPFSIIHLNYTSLHILEQSSLTVFFLISRLREFYFTFHISTWLCSLIISYFVIHVHLIKIKGQKIFS